MALHTKYSSYDSREFPPENHLLHAFVSSVPVILASYNRRVVKLSSHVDSWHICARIIPQHNFGFGADDDMYSGRHNAF